MSLITKIFGSYEAKELKKIEPIKNKVLSLEGKYHAMSDEELKGQTRILKQRLADGETTDDILPDAFAVCREAADRVLEMKHFPVQVAGGIALHRNNIAEMKTGEGKTLVATLPAYLNALTGDGVHVVTVNDYLARRDSQWMGKLYNYLGLSVGLVVHGMTPAEKKAAYAADITYGTNNEFGFDYLRDNMALYKENQVQRGFNYAIVDEVDSILIDEARTPLIISGQGDKSTDMYKVADTFAKGLTYFVIAEQDSKEDLDVITQDVIVDEKARHATLTKNGIEKVEKYFNLENYADAENMVLAHHISQALSANAIMKRDIDYIVKDGQVIIVDEFTGRLMDGRRYSDGLHQAIEAKEGVKIERESKTLATITFQNYFRMYKKLAGMTGTALSEADEFLQIYGLSVVEIPTNKPLIRKDLNDVVYKTEKGKFEAVADAAVEAHATGQPVLIGTISIEKSELVSRLLKKRGIKHEVLNAKFHEKEAEIVAQAGRYGAVTIATNMAGRGTDIILGGNAEFMAKNDMRKAGYDEEMIENATAFFNTDDEEILAARAEFARLNEKHKEELAPMAQKVRDAGGLLILGTERHESRRIDNQLRGRAGRQGDPGCTRFYVSLEDDLMRLFGGDRTASIMEKIGFDDSIPIDNKMITNTIETAQKRIEGRNFDIRKSVLQYDDVMNTQREIIYGQRGEVLNGEDVSGSVHDMVTQSISDNVHAFCSGEDPTQWNLMSLKDMYRGWLLSDTDLSYTDEQLASLTVDDIIDTVTDKAEKILAEKEALIGSEQMREFERIVLLRNVDSKWMDHIDAMDELRKGMNLRSYGQHNPYDTYRTEGFAMFDEMVESIRQDTARMLISAKIKTQSGENVKRERVAKITGTSGGGEESEVRQPIKKGRKIGRNEPCPCGSGKKYKNCHGRPGSESLEDFFRRQPMN
ncbi:MAG: preprotein translocase subunit SecA [Oscillospiraceae bacterium]|nr:preprotein translocase subunit SecA [Oscillospiraceae bacterium]